MDLQINNKVAVITGGSSGIGKATAKIFAAEGVRIILSDLDKQDLEEAAKDIREIASSDDQVVSIQADLSKADGADKLADEIEYKFGGADIVVHTAGARGAAGDFLELTDEDWLQTIDIDLMSAVRISRAFIPHMQRKGWGRLIHISSENALQPYEEESPYNACKAAVINLTKCLSRAYSNDGLLINCVSPAFVKSPMTDAMMEQEAEEKGISVDEAVDWFLENKRPHIAVNRRGTADEVAAVIAFLCSERASYVNGSNYRVDGGAVETAFG